MEASVFIGRIFVLAYLAVGLGLLLNPGAFSKVMDSMDSSPGVTYLGGIFTLIIGCLIVVSHNVWVASWPVVITIIGWGAMLKGFALLICPESMLWFTRKLGANHTIYRSIGVLVLVMAAVIGYFCFCPASQ